MKIAEVPRNRGGLFHGCDWNFDDLLGLLLHDILNHVVREEEGAVCQRLFQIKAKFAAIFRDAAPATLRQRATTGL